VRPQQHWRRAPKPHAAGDDGVVLARADAHALLRLNGGGGALRAALDAQAGAAADARTARYPV
jgi:hypothetical protein